MTLRERLSALVEAADPNGNVTFSVQWLRDQLAAETRSESPVRLQSHAASVDPNVEQVAEMFGRGCSTIRSWLAAGEFPNAYKLQGREWRIPRSDIEALQARERDAQRRAIQGAQQKTGLEPADANAADLSAWRKHVRKSA